MTARSTAEPIAEQRSPTIQGPADRDGARSVLPIARLRGFLPPVVLIGLWALISTTGAVSTRLLPAPWTVARTGCDFFFAPRKSVLAGVVGFDGVGATHVAASLWRLLFAFAIATGIGVPLGLGLGLSRRFSAFVDPLVQALRPIPTFAWLPLALVWFGLGEGATRYLIVIAALFPIVISTADGATRVPRGLVETALMLGTPRREVALRVNLPAALPSVITGLRLGLTLGWMSVIVGEMTGTSTGVGAMMTAAREAGRLDRVVVGIICFAVLGLTTDALVRALARPWIAWSVT